MFAVSEMDDTRRNNTETLEYQFLSQIHLRKA